MKPNLWVGGEGLDENWWGGIPCIRMEWGLGDMDRRVNKLKMQFLWVLKVTQATENHEDEWSLIRGLQWEVHTSISSCTLTKTLAAAAEPSSKVSSHRKSLKCTKTVPINNRFIKSRAMRRGIVLCVWRKSIESGHKHGQNFSKEGKPLWNKYILKFMAPSYG